MTYVEKYEDELEDFFKLKNLKRIRFFIDFDLADIDTTELLKDIEIGKPVYKKKHKVEIIKKKMNKKNEIDNIF